MELLLQGGTALLPDGGATRCDVYISGDSIRSLDGAPADARGFRTLNCSGMVIVPGLVNAHTHAYMTALRCCGDDLPFDRWLFRRVMPLEERMTPEQAKYSTLLGCMEMLQGGVTAFLDMHMFPHAVAEAVDISGMKAVLSRGLSGGEDDPQGGARRIREALEEVDSLQGHPRISCMLGPHAPYSCGEAYLREIADLAGERGLRLHTHLAESKGETVTVRERYGCSPVEFYDRCGILRPDTVAAHCVQLGEADIAILAERGVAVALNCASNLKLRNGTAPAAALREAGVPLCLGTDGAASNNSLSMLREMGLCALLNGDFSARDCLRMATAGGAAALGLADTGAIAVGMRADIAVFDLSDAAQQPVYDPAATLVYAAAGLTARHVLVDGVPLLEDGAFQTIDAERVLFEARRIGIAYEEILKEDAYV